MYIQDKHINNIKNVKKIINRYLTENAAILSDIDVDLDDNDFVISQKNVNKRVDTKTQLIKHELSNLLDTYTLSDWAIDELNNPDNYEKYAALIPAYDENIDDLLLYSMAFLGDNGNYNWIDTSNVTSFQSLFQYDLCFNGHIELWNTSNVETTRNMFCNAQSFNQNISNWDVSNVKDMSFMFNGAEKFNQPIGNWDISNVKDMSFMFYDAYDFNQDISNWYINDNINILNRRATKIFRNTSLKGKEYYPKNLVFEA